MNSGEIPVPEGTVVKRTLHFFWIADYSGSMAGGKIATLNTAIREAIPEVRRAAEAHPEVAIEMRAIKFADTAGWHVGPSPVAIDDFVWPELGVAGGTGTAQALKLLASELTVEKMPRRGFPPVCILVSDGFCTDPTEAYDAAITEINNLPWGKKAVRLAIAVGRESEYDEQELLKFVSHSEIGVLRADTPQKLIDYIKWASESATLGAVAGKSQASSLADQDVVVAITSRPPEQPTLSADADGVF